MKLMRNAVAAATVITSLGLAGLTGTASAASHNCEPRSTSAAFARWGDMNQYFLSHGGDFEYGSAMWGTWGSARTTAVQSPLGLSGQPGTRSLRLPAWSGAESPAMCVNHNEESVRFAMRAPFVGATLQVDVTVWAPSGYATTTTYVTASTRYWDVTPVIDMPNLRDSNGQQWITIMVMPLDDDGSWQIDDVMVDPWVAR